MWRFDVDAASGDCHAPIRELDFAGGQDFARMDCGNPRLDRDDLAERHRQLIIDFQIDGHHAVARAPDGCAHGFIQHRGGGPAMRVPGRALLGQAEGELGLDGPILAQVPGQAQAVWVGAPADEAGAVFGEFRPFSGHRAPVATIPGGPAS